MNKLFCGDKINEYINAYEIKLSLQLDKYKVFFNQTSKFT